MKEKIKHRVDLYDLFIRPLKDQKKTIVYVVLSLVVLSVAQGAIVLFMGPLMNALFDMSAMGDQVVLGDLLSKSLSSYFSVFNSIVVKKHQLAMVIPLLIFSGGLLRSVANYFYQINQQSLSLYMAKNYRDRLFTDLISLPYSEISKEPSSTWMSRIMNDVLFLQIKFADIINSFVRDSLTMIVAVVLLFLIHWPTALLFFALAPFVSKVLGRVGKKISWYTEAFQKELSKMSDSVLDIRKRFSFIRAQHGELFEQRKFSASNEGYFNLMKQSIFIRSAFAPVLEFVGFFVFAVVIYMISLKTFYSDMNHSDMFSFFVAVGFVVKPLKNIGEQLSKYHETMGALEGSFEVFNKVSEGFKVNEKIVENFADEDSVLYLKSLKAGYGGKLQVDLSNLSMQKGKSIAIVGESGSGKSTFVKVLSGLLPPMEWHANLKWDFLANEVSMVSQTPFFFLESIRSNMTYGLDQSVSDSEILEVLELVDLRKFVESLPGQLDTVVKTIDAEFSGGQLQRFVVARAFLKKKLIYVLDEATAAIDVKTEKDLTSQLILKVKTENRVLIFVTHRLQFLDLYDEVWFFDKGSLVAKGAHRDLMQNEKYRCFYGHS